MWPATFGAPLLTSAVEWLPNTEAEIESPFVDTYGAGDEIWREQWKQLLTHRRLLLQQVRGYSISSIRKTILNNFQPKLDYCFSPRKNGMDPKSVTSNEYKLPCIEFGENDWISLPDADTTNLRNVLLQFSPDIDQIFTMNTLTYLITSNLGCSLV